MSSSVRRPRRGRPAARGRTAAVVVLIGVVALAPACTGPPDLASADPLNPLRELVDAAARRLQVAEPVAVFKWRNGAAVADTGRVQQELDALALDAKSAQIDPDYVRQVFGDQIDATEAIEYSRFAQWKLDPAAAPAVAPQLSESRSAIDELNQAMVTQIGLHWDVLHSTDCGGQLSSARSDVAQNRQFDRLYRQALQVASRSYCRAPAP